METQQPESFPYHPDLVEILSFKVAVNSFILSRWLGAKLGSEDINIQHSKKYVTSKIF